MNKNHRAIGRYTGIKDKNGKKIYEGDRVQPYRINNFVNVPDVKVEESFSCQK